MNATAMEYTIIIVSTKAVKAVQEHICGLDNREWAERHAEGVARGMRLAGNKYGLFSYREWADELQTKTNNDETKIYNNRDLHQSRGNRRGRRIRSIRQTQ